MENEEIKTCLYKGSEYIYVASHGDSCVIKSLEKIDDPEGVLFVDCSEIEMTNEDIPTRMIPIEEAYKKEIYKMARVFVNAILRTPKALEELLEGPKVMTVPINDDESLQIRISRGMINNLEE